MITTMGINFAALTLKDALDLAAGDADGMPDHRMVRRCAGRARVEEKEECRRPERGEDEGRPRDERDQREQPDEKRIDPRAVALGDQGLGSSLRRTSSSAFRSLVGRCRSPEPRFARGGRSAFQLQGANRSTRIMICSGTTM